MMPTEAKIFAILTESPKTWRELTPSFPDRVEFNLAMLSLEKQKLIRCNLSTGCYEVAK